MISAKSRFFFCVIKTSFYVCVAQLVEHEAENFGVSGSTPLADIYSK